MRRTFLAFWIVSLLESILFPSLTADRCVIDGCMTLVSRVDVVIFTQSAVILRSQEFVIVVTLIEELNL